MSNETSEQLLARAYELYQREQYEDARESAEQLLAQKSEEFEALYLVGTTSRKLGDADKAMDAFTKALALEPDNSKLLSLSALTLMECARYDESINYFKKALEISPEQIVALMGCAAALSAKGDVGGAVELYRKAVEVEPMSYQAHYNMGCSLMSLGQNGDAIQALDKVIELKPDFVEAYQNKGALLVQAGRPTEAIKVFAKALEINPEYDPVYLPFIEALQQCEQNIDATNMCLAVLAHQPDNYQIRQVLVRVMNKIPIEEIGEGHVAELINNYYSPDINHQNMIGLVMRIIMANPETNRVMLMGEEELVATFNDGTLSHFFSQPLLIESMLNGLIVNLEFEGLLRKLRKVILLECTRGGPATATNSLLPFMVSLAVQCHINEYLYPEDEQEKGMVTEVQSEINKLINQGEVGSDSVLILLSLYAMYRSLYTLSSWESISELDEPLFMPLQAQLHEFIRESELKKRIKSFSDIDDETSRLVQEQYEESPYPRWISVDKVKPGTRVQTIFNQYLKFSHLSKLANPDTILIAGCGTGQQPLFFATLFPDAKITALDLSRSSLAYAMRKAEEMGVTNVTFYHGDILELATSGQQYDMVLCSGVLHHMRDPFAGWSALRSVLASDGAMGISLYSAHARKALYTIKEKITEMDVGDDLETIRNIRLGRDVIDFDNPAVHSLMANSTDFYSLSGFRDLVFHRQEHGYTIPEIKGCLDKLGLRFVGFEYNARHYDKFFSFYGKEAMIDDLTLWDGFEQQYPETFSAMYSFWCEPK